MAHTQKPDFVFRRNGRIHLNRRGRQFSRLQAAEVCASAVVILDTPCSEVMWRVLATHSIRQFPLHFPFLASPCEITFQLEYTTLPSSAEEGLQNTPVKRLKGDNPTTGLPSGRLATGLWEFSITFKPQSKDKYRQNISKVIANTQYFLSTNVHVPIPVVARSKA